MSPTEAANVLDNNPDFKVLRRVQLPEQFHDLSGVKDVNRMLVIDVETTGLDAQKEKIIEFAGLLIEFSPSRGQFGKVLGRYHGYQDPGFPLPPEIQTLTGLTDEMLAGQKLDIPAILNLLGQCRVVTAHSANLDRKFCEAQIPEFAKRWWACSYQEGPWKDMGIGSAKLDYLVAMVGNAFYDAHRAINDVEALVHLLSSPGAGGQTVLHNMLERARFPSYRIWATGAPFDVKDQLHAGGYEWNGNDVYVDRELLFPKSWNKSVRSKEELDAELEKLAPLHPGGRILVDALSGLDRYALRSGQRESITLPGKAYRPSR